MQDSAPARCHGSRGQKSNKEEVTKEANTEQGMISAEDAAPAEATKATKAKNDASSFCALLVIVAAAFCAVSIPHMTKPSVANKLAEVNYPVACPPQWLPALLASSPSPPPSSPRPPTLPPSPPASPPVPVLELNVTYYDFPTSHPDFERSCSNTATLSNPSVGGWLCLGEEGLVQTTLGSNGRCRAL